jgi:hypothetical protein
MPITPSRYAEGLKACKRTCAEVSGGSDMMDLRASNKDTFFLCLCLAIHHTSGRRDASRFFFRDGGTPQ